MNSNTKPARPIQYFSKEYLELCKTMTPLQILQFEEDFQTLMSFNCAKEKKDTKDHMA